MNLLKPEAILKDFSGFTKYLKESSVFSNNKFKKVIEEFSFILISEKDELSYYFEKSQMINQNIKNTKVIIIDKNDFLNKYTEDKFIIVCFEKTLIILKQIMIFSIYTLLSNNLNLSVCFLKNTKEIFTEQIKNPIIEYNEIFKEEIYNINIQLKIVNKSSTFPFWPCISPCISAYLIKKSYFINSQNRILCFNNFSPNSFLLGEVDKKDFIELRIIGFGSLFTCNLIYHIERGELFVIKKPNSIDNEIGKLMQREKSNYEKIHCPYIPKFYGTVKEDDFIIIEFINGQTLEDFQFNEYNENDIFMIIFKLLFIVDYFHRNGFLIRDLKPNNFMIIEKNDIVMIDFDRIVRKETKIYSHDLNNEYSAPEVKNNELYSEKSDIYSLGKVIEYILNKIDFKYEISAINDIIKQCLEIKPDQRPSIQRVICDFFDKTSMISSISSVLLYQNDSETQFRLGYIYNTGEYIERDINKAIHYYLLASNQNHAKAQFNLGVIYDNGKYVERDIKKAIHYYTLASNHNYPEAQNNLGVIYESEKYIERDINKAIYYYSLASNQNYPKAQYNLATIYESGKYIERDINKAIYYYSLASNQNDPYAQFRLGVIYETGKYVERNINKAIHYYSLASNQNHPKAQYNLGTIYESGEYIERDINKAIYYYSLASNQNHSEAQFRLGVIYGTGKYIKRDINKAIHYYSLASNQNHPKAQYNLGVIYESGEYIKRDINKAIHYYSLASNQNYSEAQFNLGVIYFAGIYIEQNINKAIYYFTLASNNNHPESQYNLGILYYKGEYVKQDINKAINYFLLASNQNIPHAQFNLGVIYYTGKYVKQDINKAIKYLLLASNQSIPQAQCTIGYEYYKGKHIERDINKAIHYLSLASNQNIPQAHYNLGVIYETGKFVKRDISKAIHYFSLASNQNFSQAQYDLGIIYETGEYVKRDINKAIYYYSLASNHNHPKALFKLGTIYYSGIYCKQDLIKGRHYILLSSYYNYRLANFCHGFFLHKEMNIIDAIHYYKEASSFNIQYAKNNLGIIYKKGFGDKIQKRIANSIEYFKEAIQQENDILSMYNLAHIYIYDETIKHNIEKSIELLIKSSNKFKYSLNLLCLVLIKTFGFDIEKIKSEIDKRVEKNNELYVKITVMINILIDWGELYVNCLYEDYRNKDFLYDVLFEYICTSDLLKEKIDIEKEIPNLKEISEDFYDGFGYD